MYGLTVVTGPAKEPVALAEAKSHLRVEQDDDDDYIRALIIAARNCVEAQLQRALVTQTFELTLDSFPYSDPLFPWSAGTIRLPRSPVLSVGSVKYIDFSGTLQTMDPSLYRLDAASLVARLTPAYGTVWPPTRPITNAVTIRFDAGYGPNATDVPEPIKQAMKLMVGTYYDPVREIVIIGDVATPIPRAAEFLLGPYRVASQPGAI